MLTAQRTRRVSSPSRPAPQVSDDESEPMASVDEPENAVEADRDSLEEAAEIERRTREFAPLEHAELTQAAVRLSLERDLAFAFAGDLSRQITRVRGAMKAGKAGAAAGTGTVTSLENAIALALEVRRGQRDASGEAAILQMLRGMFRRKTELEKIVALLMDVVKATSVTLDDLREMGFVDDVISALAAASSDSTPGDYTPRQGQFLAFIHHYAKVSGQAATDRDLERYFQLSSSSVRDMMERLAWGKFVAASGDTPRTYRVLIPVEQVPELE